MSFRTTICGVLTVIIGGIGGVIAAVQTSPELSMKVIAAAFAAGCATTGAGLFFARDNKVTSEQAGLKNVTPKTPASVED